MKARVLDFLPSAIAAVGLALSVAFFLAESASFRQAVGTWAWHDLDERTHLAAATLTEPLATGDFRRLREFGSACMRDGVRLTVYSKPGGLVYDSLEQGAHQPDDLYASARAGDFMVRLGLPRARVFAPFARARLGLVLAGLMGGSGVLLVFLCTWRWRARIRLLAQERDEQCRRLELLRQSEEYRRAFVADVSHEIKTPLTGILGAVDLLDAPEEPPPETRRMLVGMLRRESRRLDDLAQDVLELSRLDDVLTSKRVMGTVAPIDLASLVRDVVARFQPEAHKGNVALACGMVESLVVSCDATRVERAISNLVANALRHSGSPTVCVTLARQGPWAEVSVTDRGCGIPPECRQKVFERFYRVDEARSAALGGAGLGLALVRQIACCHGGECVLVSPPEGGAQFLFRLPLESDFSVNKTQKGTT